MNEFITRTGGGEYEVIFKTNSRKNYLTVQDVCREMVDHKKPDEPVRVVRCKDCKYWDKSTARHEKDFLIGEWDTAECKQICHYDTWNEFPDDLRRTCGGWYCADGEKERTDEEEA